MPQNRNNPPIGRMTWGRAIPVLGVCLIFDFLRFIFEWFIFFGPALAAAACTAGVNNAVGTTLADTAGKLIAAGCAATAGTAGFFGAGPLEVFGMVMAMAIGLLGWGVVTLVLAITNPRIWKSGTWGWVWSIFGLGISEVPFLGTIPMLTITHVRLYAGQIRKDKAALKQYQQEQGRVTAAVRAAQKQKSLDQMLVQAAQEEEEIPEEVRRAA